MHCVQNQVYTASGASVRALSATDLAAGDPYNRFARLRTRVASREASCTAAAAATPPSYDTGDASVSAAASTRAAVGARSPLLPLERAHTAPAPLDTG